MKNLRPTKRAINPRVLASLLTVAALMNQAFLPASKATDVHKDWILKVQTEELQRQFDYKGSKLKNVAKVTVEFYHESDLGNVKPYEQVYYHNGKPIGMKRTGDLGIPAAQSVVIKVTHKGTVGSEEEKATANILWRLGLNVTHNHDALISTIVPLTSFDKIVQELEALGFRESESEGENANTAKALLALESEPSAKTQKLYFY